MTCCGGSTERSSTCSTMTPAVIIVQHFLHQRLAGGLDQLAVCGEDLLDLRLADDLAHRAFGHGLHRRCGLATLKA